MKAGGLMIDMDGTVCKGMDIIPGADDFIDFLKSNGIPFVFLTNNSSRTRDYYLEKLNRMGFGISAGNILTSANASARYIRGKYPDARVYPVASPEVSAELEASGLNIDYDNPDTVLLTFDRTITYDKINTCYRLLRDGAGFIATHPDDVCPTETSYDIDIGPFIRMFEQMCDSKPEIVGKPGRLMLKMASEAMGIDPETAVMVGDRLYTDI